ncbi:MAG: hypothetical protein IT317_03885 [Anaerolineales bacterium]|nr:hypothetical protein [Anaerolineales bacterium]
MENSRSDILSQLAAGTISAAQAAAQLRGEAVPPAATPPTDTPPTDTPPTDTPAAAALGQRWLRIRVTDLSTGRPKVNVNLPLTWVAAGLCIGRNYSPQLEGLDLGALLGDLEAGANGQLVDVEDVEDDERVQIYVE